MGELYNPFPRLPKNIRQIGERDETVRLYLEDYVNTYLKRLYPAGGQDLRAGLLLGSVEEQDGTPYIFVDGAMEMEGITGEGETVAFTEEAWKKAYQEIEEQFPKRTVQGWFLCGAPGCALSPLNYWKQHSRYFSGKHQLMYLNSGLEGEEAVYVTSSDGFYKLRGHCIYYERNQMMQDYMVTRKDSRRVEAGGSDPVIQDFRKRMEDKKSQAASRQNTVHVLGGLCSALAIMVLAGGITMFNNYEKMRDMESVIASVLPGDWETYQESGGESVPAGDREGSVSAVDSGDAQAGIVVEQVPGGVFPTEGLVEEATPAANPEAEGVSLEGGTEEDGQAVDGLAASQAAPELAAGEPVSSAVSAMEPAAEAKSQAEPVSAVPLVTEPGPGQMAYIVQDGETLYGICFKLYQNVNSLEEICRLNGLTDQNRITAGQKLIVPEAANAESEAAQVSGTAADGTEL